MEPTASSSIIGDLHRPAVDHHALHHQVEDRRDDHHRRRAPARRALPARQRLDERMDTVERLVASDNPEFKPARIMHDRDIDNEPLRELDRLLAEKKGTASEQPAHHALSRQAERQADGRLRRASPTTPGSTRSGSGWAASLLTLHDRRRRSSRPTSSPASCLNKKPAAPLRRPRRAEVLAARPPVARRAPRARSAPASATSTAAWPRSRPTTSPATRACRPRSNGCAERATKGN